MAETSLNQLLTLINQQVEFQEALNEQLSKAEALAYIAISSEICWNTLKQSFITSCGY